MYPDYRAIEEQEMTQYFQEQDYSNVSDWSVLFSTHQDFCNALHHTNHVMHKQAKQIKANKDRNKNIVDFGTFDGRTQESIDNYYANMPNWAK